MVSRYYFAWRMLVEARGLDQITYLTRVRAHVRDIFDPVADLTDVGFVKSYRLSKLAFIFLMDELRSRTTLKSTQRVSMETKVLAALSFYASGSYQHPVGMANNFSQQSISNYVAQVTAAINAPDFINHFIRFPTLREERDSIQMKFYSKYGIPSTIGFVDGCHFKIFSPKKALEHLFYCRKHYHSLNVLMVCDSDCRILAVNPKFGGAAHDAFVWESSTVNDYMRSLYNAGETVWLLGDSGYPLRPWLMTPCTNEDPGSDEAYYTIKHGTARVVIENTFGRLKNRWRCTSKDRVLHYAPAKCAQIITACCVLHNICIEYNLPDPEEPQDATEDFVRVEVPENVRTDELTLGRALRDRLIRRLVAERGVGHTAFHRE